jgi:hypothetical protein
MQASTASGLASHGEASALVRSSSDGEDWVIRSMVADPRKSA